MIEAAGVPWCRSVPSARECRRLRGEELTTHDVARGEMGSCRDQQPSGWIACAEWSAHARRVVSLTAGL